MLKGNIKTIIKNPLNLLWFILLPVGWYMGTQTIRMNIDLLQSISSRPDVSQTAIEALSKQISSINGYMVFAEGISEFYVSVAAVLLGGIIFSSAFAYDKNTGFGDYCITRSNFKKYYFSKILSIIICEFAFIFVTLSGIFLFSLIKYSAIHPTDDFNFSMVIDTLSTYKLFFAKPLLSCFIMIITICIYATALSLIGFGISAFTSNRFLISVSPIALYIVLTIIPQVFKIKTTLSCILAWLFPQYFTSLFINNDLWYSKMTSFGAIYCTHLAVILLPTIVLLTVLYQKNKKQYIK